MTRSHFITALLPSPFVGKVKAPADIQRNWKTEREAFEAAQSSVLFGRGEIVFNKRTMEILKEADGNRLK